MPAQTIVLTDTANGIWHHEFQMDHTGGPDVPADPNWSIRKTTLHGGRSQGVEVVELDNGRFRMSILPTRGMGLWKGELGSVPVGWSSPVRQPVHPAFVDLNDRGGLGWLSGFNELLCRCGLSWNGPPGMDVVHHEDGSSTQTPLTLHGRVANIPAHYVACEASGEEVGKIAVTGVVDESSMFGPCLRLTSRVETRIGANGLTITDTIRNLGGQPAEMQLLYHTNIGRPFLEPGATFAAPIGTIAPRDPVAAAAVKEYANYPAPEPGFAEQAYFMELLADKRDRTLVILHNAAADRAVCLRFERSQVPCFTLWKNTSAEADGYVTGLEPATNFPNLKTFERAEGRVVVLAPEQEYTVRLELSVHDTSEGVAAPLDEVNCLQRAAAPDVQREPDSRFSPV